MLQLRSLKKVVITGLVGCTVLASAVAAPMKQAVAQTDEIVIGLITKTETNPFFVKMREGAQAKADELGVKLLTAAGSFDGDNESQVTAMENMINAGVKGILLVPSDTKAIVPSIEKARAAGVLVIALDTPTDPEDASNALFATDNFKAGVLIGQWAKAKNAGKPAKIALLNLNPGITVGELRVTGFLEGFGIERDDAQVVCEQDTQGDQSKGQTAMENCLTADPEISIVYAINEPAAFGAYTALEAAGRAKDTMIVAVDGGCQGIEGVVSGQIDATSQQYPLRMASLGVEAVVNFAKTGESPTGYTDTGVTLITNDPQMGIDSEGVIFGTNSCWGENAEGALEAATAAETAMLTALYKGEGVTIGLITKTETNPFFVKMREGAQAKADQYGAKLLTAAGSFDGDNESQVTAIENMINAGVKGILLVPSDTKAIVPSIEKARAAGVLVIALDTPTDPEDASNALFATDNFKAGVLIGQWAKAKNAGKPAKIALLNLNPGITVGELRVTGFLEGFGIKRDDAQVVCEQDTQGDQSKGQTAMENCLTADPDITIVYAINEPAAFGASTALKAAGKTNDDIIVVAVDGGCAGVRGVVEGQIDATSQQYPLKMASLGVEAVLRYANTNVSPTGYTDTGVTLITDQPQARLSSEDTKFGLDACWGE